MSGSRPLPGEPGSRSCVFYSYPIVFILCMHLGGSCGVHHCVVLGVTMANDIIYRGLFPVGNLNNKKPSWGKYHHLSCMMNDPTSPVGRKLMIHMSHRATYYSFVRILVDCVASTLWLSVYWCIQLIIRVLIMSHALATLFVFRHVVSSAMRLLLDRYCPAVFIFFIHIGVAIVCTTLFHVRWNESGWYYLQGSIPC